MAEVTAQVLINSAYRKLGAINSIDGPTPEQTADALVALNSMLGAWSTRDFFVPVLTSESFATSATVSYTMGSGGTASSVRAKKIIAGFIRDSSNVDFPLEIKKFDEYQTISVKTNTGMPSQLFYNPTYPVGYIYLDRVPDAAYTIYIDSLKALSNLAAASTTVELPDEYKEAIIYNLSVRLAPEIPLPVPNDVGIMAVQSMNTIIGLNESQYSGKLKMPAGMPGISSGYSIETG